jgi:preprotein translocase subunit SecE
LYFFFFVHLQALEIIKNSIMSKFGNYIQAAYDELVHKVNWPTWSELQQTTLIVLAALALITVLILGMDVSSDVVLRFIYNLLGK